MHEWVDRGPTHQPDTGEADVEALVVDPHAEHADGRGSGFRYLTVQVRDVVAEHARLCQLGWGEVAAPIRHGDVAAISFVRDPDGTVVELSQRASLTGPLHDHH